MNTPDEMIKMALLNMRPRRGRRVRWGVASDLFGLGSYSARKLCKKHGVDPDEMIDGPRERFAWIATQPCEKIAENGQMDCSQTGDCITEWCYPCYARKALEQ